MSRTTGARELRGRSLFLPALPIAFALATGACAPGPAAPPVAEERIALAPRFATGAALVETAAIDAGTPGGRPRLARGFGPDEMAGTTSFTWGLGEASELRFDLVEPRRLRLRLRGWSYPFADGGGVGLDLRLNGRAIGEAELGPAPETLAVDLPATALAVGENRLEIRYRRSAEVGSGRNRRALAAAWDGFRLEGVQETAAPAVDSKGSALRIPWRTAFELPLELPRGGRLLWGAIETAGAGELEIALERDGETRPASWRALARAGGSLAIAPAGEPVRLRLRARSAEEPSSAGVLARDLALAVPAVEAGRPAPAAPPARARPNVVVYLVDALRADHVGAYGYGPPTTPALDAVAREGVVCAHARAQSSWTRPAVATVLTGLSPYTHRTMDALQRLPEEIETLAERLGAAGYRTGFVTTNVNVSEKFGFRQGSELFSYLTGRRGGRAAKAESTRVNEVAIRWLDSLAGDAPFFLFLHTVDPHAPYEPDARLLARFAPEPGDPRLGQRRALARLERADTPPDARKMAQLLALYDAEIAANDEAFGALIGWLEQKGLWDDTLLLFLSDHGEEFLDHGKTEHGRTLYEEQLRVPMVWKLPGNLGAGRRLETPVDQIDVAPTILEAAGLDVPAALPGRSLWPALVDGAALAERPSVALLDRLSYAFESVYDRGFKLIRRLDRDTYRERPLEQLFDLAHDPFERADRASELPVRRALLESRLRAERLAVGPAHAPGEVALDRDLERSLRALGYLD